MSLDYEQEWTGGTRPSGPCDCHPIEDDKGLVHRSPSRERRECPLWVVEWRRRAAAKDMTGGNA